MPMPKWFSVRFDLERLDDRSVPALLGKQLFPADNPWNQRVDAAPVAANSTAVMDNIITRYGDGRFHPDFGQDYGDSSALYGIPINVVHGKTTTKTTVLINAYPDESDLIPAPIPSNPVIEGDRQNGPRLGVNNRGDSHLLIWDMDNNVAYEFFRASRPGENGDHRWHADQESVWDMKTNSFRTLGWTSADAAGLSILAGLARPDEGRPVDQGGQGVINHALRFTLQNSIILDKYIYPASHHANPGSNNPAIQPPMGSRFRLKPGVDISTLNPQARIIAQAMKDYGLIVTDNGSNFFLVGSSYSVDATNRRTLTWDDNDVQDTAHGLKSLHFSDFELVDLTPAVTGLSTNFGSTGSSVTIIGRNFGGAAGHLKVTFGGVAATAVTVVDDSHVTATVPAGSGTVDVFVQSGVTGVSEDNATSPIFGYGVSTNTSADDFTFVPAGNQAPTVASPASAAPSPVFGKTTALHVLGADDAGEASLSYTWAVTAKPAGAADPTFNVNGTHAANDSVATFTKAGNYTLRATIADAEGLTVTSSVTVTVKQTLTRISLSPTSVDVPRWGQVQFSALALDQFDDPLTLQPRLTWRLTGKGFLTSTGLCYAPSQRGGPYTIAVSYGTIRATTTVRVV